VIFYHHWRSTAFSAQTIVNLFARFYGLAGIKGASSHSGRRQFLIELADKGVNVRVRASCGTRLSCSKKNLKNFKKDYF